MKKKITKKTVKKFRLWALLAFAAVGYLGMIISVGTFVAMAQGDNKIQDLTTLANSINETNKDVMAGVVNGMQNLGAYIADPTRFTDVNITNDLVVDGQTTFTGTSTPSLHTNPAINIAATFQTATATTNVAADGTQITAPLAVYTNTGADILCDQVWYDIYTAGGGNLTYSFAIGTTTYIASSPSLTTTSTATIMASSTVATTDTFENKGSTINNEYYPGSYFVRNSTGMASSSIFMLKNGESLVLSWHTFNATSSNSFYRQSGNFLPTASLKARCWAR